MFARVHQAPAIDLCIRHWGATSPRLSPGQLQQPRDPLRTLCVEPRRTAKMPINAHLHVQGNTAWTSPALQVPFLDA